jgi:peptidyl-prolyl cis-trans isomerase D
MISWTQRTFQQHFKVVFAVLLGLMIISFVFTIGAAPGIGRADRTGLKREFFGYNLSSQEDQQRLMGDAGLSANLQVGYGLEADQVQNYAFQRAASLNLADSLHIPAATATEIADQIKTLRAFAGEDGQFDAKRYATFRDNLKTNPRLTEADIARVIGDDVRADKVQKLLGGPGYVLVNDVKNQLARADTSWTVVTATVDYASFNPSIAPTDADLTKFFEENSFRYEISPRLVATYIDFPATDYLSQVNFTDAEVRAHYDADPSRFPKPAADPKAPATVKVDAAADYAAVRPQVELALRFERAQRLATKAASDFVFSLYEAKVTADSPALANLLAAHKSPLKSLAPFTREVGPTEFGTAAPSIAEEAFKLNKDRIYSEALPTRAGAVVLFWKEIQPSRKPALAEVRAKVTTDYTENEKRKRFVELGRTLRSLIENRLKSGDTFEKAAAAAATGTSAKIEAKAVPAFTLRNRPQDLDYTVLSSLEHLEQGQVSDLAINADKGTFVYVVAKKTPDFSPSNPLYAETHTQLATYTARLGSSAYLADLVSNELKRSEPTEK